LSFSLSQIALNFFLCYDGSVLDYFSWGQLFLGIWIIVSPWLLGFSDIGPALWSNVIGGVLIALASLWKIFLPRE